MGQFAYCGVERLTVERLTACELTIFVNWPCVPAEEVGEIIFRKPVDVGDLIKFKSNVLAAWQSEEDPCRVREHPGE